MTEHDEKNYTIVDFKQGTMEYWPYVKKVRFILPSDEKTYQPYIVMSYSDSAAEKLFWISSHLRKLGRQAVISLYSQKSGNILSGNCLMEVPDFPVTDFAKNFRIEGILKRNIREMQVSVLAPFGIEVLSPELFYFFSGSSYKLYIDCESPFLELEPGYSLDAQVTFPDFQ